MVVAEGLEKSAEGVPVVDYGFARFACARVLAELRRHDPVVAGTVEGCHSRLG